MLHEKIESDLKTALKSGEKEKAGVLRLLLSALKNFQIEKKTQAEKYLGDADVVSVLGRQAKQRRDSIMQYEQGGRTDLADQEKEELATIESYLPAQMDEARVREAVKTKKSELGIADKSGFGRLMGEVMKELKGQADGDAVKRIVEEELG